MHETRKQPTRASEDERRARESAAILRRIREETEPQVGVRGAQLFAKARGHLAGDDADDRIERLGTRIGRSLGAAAFLVLAGLLAARFLAG